MQLELEQVRHHYGELEALCGLSMRLDEGQIGCLLGPSGCGKSTALRCIAGFEPVSGGVIRLGDEEVSSTGAHVPPEQRRVGMVFQDHALFPHLSVLGNVMFGLVHLARAQRERAARKMLTLVGLADSAGRLPHALSGGQRQRVALARALAPEPHLLLLDEPFSNLDAGLRVALGREVRAILKARSATALLVTHDQQEAFAIADRVGVMAQGRLHQWATPSVLYRSPANRFVGDFVGDGVYVQGHASDRDTVRTSLGQVQSDRPLHPAQAVHVLVRPEQVRLERGSGQPVGEVTACDFRGEDARCEVRLSDGTLLLASIPNDVALVPGARVQVTLTSGPYAVPDKYFT